MSPISLLGPVVETPIALQSIRICQPPSVKANVSAIINGLGRLFVRSWTQWEETAVLFSDIVNFSVQARQHRRQAEQEALYQFLVEQYQPALSQAVCRHDGRVVKFMGDGMLAVFPSVAAGVQAGQAILQTLEPLLQDRPAGVHCRFETRLALDAGPVLHRISGPIWRRERDVLGDPVNRAAHLANTGPGNILLLSAEAYRHLDDPSTSWRLQPSPLADQTPVYQVC